MKITRKTNGYYNPLTKKKSFNTRFVVKDAGNVDFCWMVAYRKGRKVNAVQSQVMSLVNELTNLLLNGYNVKVIGLGTISADMVSKSTPYDNANSLDKSSISKVKFRLRPAKELRIKIEDAVRQAEIE